MSNILKTALSAVIVISSIISVVQADCAATASVSTQSSWQSQDRTNNLYAVSVVNSGSCDITDLSVSISVSGSSSIAQSWNLQATSGDVYKVLNFGGTITTGSIFTGSGFILSYDSTSSAAVTVAVSSVSCVSSCPAGNTNGLPAGQALVSQDLLNSLQLAATEVKKEALLKNNDFVFDFVSAITGITKGSGGKTVAATRENFPALIGNGVAMTVGYIDACSINLPHSHPRATEINFIVSGEFEAGFFTENGARFIGNTLKPGMATVFPRGAIHFEMNLGCQTATFVAAFNSEDPGVQTTTSTFFGLPLDLVASSLNVSAIQSVEELARHLPKNPAIALGDCKTRCGLN